MTKMRVESLAGGGGGGSGGDAMQFNKRKQKERIGLSLCAIVAVVLLCLELGYGVQTVSAATSVRHNRRHLAAGTLTPTQRLDKALTDSLERAVVVQLTEDVTLTHALTQFWGRIHIKGACGGRKCVIDGARKFPIFDSLRVAPDCHLTLENVIIRNAKGGAVRGKCDVKAVNTHFLNNDGGAIGIHLGLARWDVEGCLFEGNFGSHGAGIYSSSSGGGKVVNTVFRKNRATHGSGGAVYIDDRGYDKTHFRVFDRVTFDSNTARESGGAVYMTAFNYDSRTIFFLATTFKGNSAINGYGGAVAFESLVYARFCAGSTIAGGGNKAGAGKGNDIALIKSQYYPSHTVEFCPRVPAGLSLYVTPDPEIKVTVKGHCRGCTPPSS